MTARFGFLFFGTLRFLWQRAERNRETCGVALGCVLAVVASALYDFARHSNDAQMFRVLRCVTAFHLLYAPLLTGLLARRRVMLWGALVNSLSVPYFLMLSLAHIGWADFYNGFSCHSELSLRSWLVALTITQAISLLTTVPLTLHFRNQKLRNQKS